MKTVKMKNKEQVKTILRKVFFLSSVKTIGIAIPSYLWVVYHLLKEERNPILAYLSYFLSAYALVITVTGMIRMIMTGCTGAVICLLIIGLALYMLITSTRKLHTGGNE